MLMRSVKKDDGFYYVPVIDCIDFLADFIGIDYESGCGDYMRSLYEYSDLTALETDALDAINDYLCDTVSPDDSRAVAFVRDARLYAVAVLSFECIRRRVYKARLANPDALRAVVLPATYDNGFLADLTAIEVFASIVYNRLSNLGGV